MEDNNIQIKHPSIIANIVVDGDILYRYIYTIRKINDSHNDIDQLEILEKKRKDLHDNLLSFAKVDRNSEFERQLEKIVEDQISTFDPTNLINISLEMILDTKYSVLTGKGYPKCSNCGYYQYHYPVINICKYCGSEIQRIDWTIRDIIISDNVFGSGGFNTLWSLLERKYNDHLPEKAVALYNSMIGIKETKCSKCGSLFKTYDEVKEHYINRLECRGKFFNIR